jgi:hypothetical protein
MGATVSACSGEVRAVRRQEHAPLKDFWSISRSNLIGICSRANWLRAIAPLGGTLAVAGLLFVFNQASPGARANALATQFADRFNSVWFNSVGHQPAHGTAALAMLPPDSSNDMVSTPSRAVPTEAVDVGTDIFDADLSPRSQSARAAFPTNQKANRPSASSPPRPRYAGPMTSVATPTEAYASAFSLPDVSYVAVPAAASGAAALAAYEFWRASANYMAHAGALSYRSSTTWTAPDPATTPMTLPGPFHVFMTTEPGTGAAAIDSGGGSGNGNGNGNGVVGGVVNGVGNTVGGTLGAVGGTLGAVNGVATGVVNGLGNALGHRK